MPPLACGVGLGAPWRSVLGEPPLPPPPSLARLVGAWWHERGVALSAGRVSSWRTYAHRGAGPYDMTLLDGTAPTQEPSGIRFASQARLWSTCGPWGPGAAAVVRYARNPAQHGALPLSVVASLFGPSAFGGAMNLFFPLGSPLLTAGWYGVGFVPSTFTTPIGVVDARVATVGTGIDDGGSTITRVVQRGPESGDNSGSGLVTTTNGDASANARIGGSAAEPFLGDVLGLLVYDAGLTALELAAAADYLEAL